MIHGIGTDIVRIARLAAMWERHGEKSAERLLAPDELVEFAAVVDKGRFLAKRWAAKEAFGKALGTGIRPPALLPAIAVGHDQLGRPYFKFNTELSEYMAQSNLCSHLSLSDESDLAIAYVILEKP